MLPMKLTEAAQTEWPLQIVLVPQKDGTLQFCVDDRKLIAVDSRG